MNLKTTKLSKAIYRLFFGSKGRKKRKLSKKDNVSKRASANEPEKPLSKLPKAGIPVKPRYDLTHLHEQVSETEYITNLRLGRSWIFPKLIRMGFIKIKGEYVFDIDTFLGSFHSEYGFYPQKRRHVWNLMIQNYKAIAQSNERDVRAKWWTKELFQDMLSWDCAITGRRTRGLNVEECRRVVRDSNSLSSYKQISAAIVWYDKNRMRLREGHKIALPYKFVNAYLADGAYHAMMTMVKVYNLRLKSETGEGLSRDESIIEIEKQAENSTGLELMSYCKSRFFDSGIFDYERYS